MNDITELVKMAVNGDRAAFDSLYEQTKSGVWFTCISLLKNEENAKDIMQDTYLTAFDKLNTLENHAAFKTWLNKIAANKCKNFLVAKANSAVESNSEEILEKIPDDKFLPEEYVTDAEKRKIIMDIIEDVLSVNQYRTIILYYFDEMSVAEIAELMDCHEKTVQYRLKTARVKIKEEIMRYEEENRDKLHAVAPFVPFVPLARIFRACAENVSVPSILAVHTASPELSNALNVPSDQAAAAVNTGGKAMLNSLKAKMIAGACAAVVVGGGVTAGVLIANNSKNNTESRPSFSAPANTSTPVNTSAPANVSKPSGGSKPESTQSKPTTSQSDVPKFEGLTPIELLRSTGDYREHDPDIISGNIKDAYLTDKDSYILLTNDGDLFLYKLELGDYTPISFGKDTGITKLDNMLFKTDNVDHSLTVVDGNRVFFKSINAEGEVNLSTNGGNERAAQGVLFEGRNMHQILVDMYLEVLYVIDEDGNGFKLTNRFMNPMEFTTEKYVYADTSECFSYNPKETESFIYNGMKIRQRAGKCFISEDDKLYFHRAGSGLASKAPIEELADIDFERVFHSRSTFMYNNSCYSGVTKDGRVTVLNVEEDADNVAHAEVVFSGDKPDGDIQNVWVNSDRIVVKTDKGCFYAKYDEDDTLKPLDALNALNEDVVYICDNKVLLSNGYLYKIDAFKN